MQKLKALYYSISKSLTSIPYYKDLENVRPSFSYKYYLGLSLLLAFILSLGFVFLKANKVVAEVKSTATLVKKMYEDDLVITMKNGEWSLNKPEPYAVNLNINQPGEDPLTSGKKHFIILAHEGTLDKFDEYDTHVLINAKNLISKDRNGFSVTPIEKLNIPNGQITKTDFNYFVDGLLGYTKWIKPLGFLLSLIGWFLFFVLIKGSNLFVVALPLWLFGQIISYNLKFKYSDALKITLHAATLPMLIFTATKLFNYEQLDKGLLIWVEVATMLLGIFIIGFLNKMGKSVNPSPAIASSEDNMVEEPKTELP